MMSFATTYYKYCSPARIDVLRNMEIRYTQPVCFNDPFETVPAAKNGIHTLPYTQRQKAYDELRSSKKIDLDQKKGRQRIAFANERALLHLRKFAAHEIGVLSLSKRWDNQLMWASYACDHKGFVLGFFPYFSVPFGDALLLTEPQEVKYQERRPEIDLFPYVKNINQASYEFNFIDAISKYQAEIFFTKSSIWKHEEEVRLLCTFSDAFHRKIDVEPYPIYLRTIHEHELASIIVGINSSDELAEELRQISKQRKISYYRAFKDAATYSIGLWDAHTAEQKMQAFGDKIHIGYRHSRKNSSSGRGFGTPC